MNMAKREAATGDQDCSAGAPVPDDEPELYAIKVNMTMDPELLRRAMAAETEAALLRAAIDQKHAERLSLKQHLRLAVNHIAALNGALDDLASLGATIAICGTKYDDAAARKALES